MNFHVLTAINNAWDHHGPALLSNPTELKKRLARRLSRQMSRTPRAWTLALRANDTRIDRPVRWIQHKYGPDLDISPDPRNGHPPEPGEEQLVQIEAETLRRLCAPITMGTVAMTAEYAAALFGVPRSTIMSMVRRGLFTATRQDVGKSCGKVIVRLARDLDSVDPNWIIPGKHVDPSWGDWWRNHTHHVPDDFFQDVTRMYFNREYTPKPPPPKRGQPPFEPHPVDTACGWRWLCPRCDRRAALLYLPLPIWTIPIARGDEPAAHAFEHMIVQTPAQKAREPLSDFARTHLSLPAHANSYLACKHCHRIQSERQSGQATTWNRLVFYLTGGLLYGHEVPHPQHPLHTPPDWTAKTYTHAFATTGQKRFPVPTSSLALQSQPTESPGGSAAQAVPRTVAPSVLGPHAQRGEFPLPYARPYKKKNGLQRNKVLILLLSGQSPKQIATTLNLTPVSLHTHLHRLYQLHNITARYAAHEDLRAKLLNNPTLSRPGPRAAALKTKGLTHKQIADEMNLPIKKIRKLIEYQRRLARHEIIPATSSGI